MMYMVFNRRTHKVRTCTKTPTSRKLTTRSLHYYIYIVCCMCTTMHIMKYFISNIFFIWIYYRCVDFFKVSNATMPGSVLVLLFDATCTSKRVSVPYENVHASRNFYLLACRLFMSAYYYWEHPLIYKSRNIITSSCHHQYHFYLHWQQSSSLYLFKFCLYG